MATKRLKYGLLASFLLAIVSISGCVQQNQPAVTNTSSEVSVTIKDFAFDPPNITIRAGATVTWVNEDSVLHTVTDMGVFDSGNLNKGESFSHTFNEAGTFDYSCTHHPYMKGEITVEV